MGSLVPGLELVIPVDADGPLLDPDVAPDVRVHVPYAVRPEAVETAVGPWMDKRNSVSIALEPLPADAFTPRQRSVDLALRAVHAWTLEPREILLEHALVDGPDGVQTDLTAAVWRTLADQLGGRRFAGAVDLGDDVHGWLFEGDNDLLDRPDTSLVVWTDHHPLGDARRVSLVLGSARMDASDVFGNASPVPFEDGAHQLVFDHSPVFVEGVDPKLIHFRHAMRIEPADLPTAHRGHEAHIVVANPWPSDIMVRLRIGESSMRVTPDDGELVIPSGEEARLPIQLIVPVGTARGTHWIEASVELRAEHRYRLNARLPITLDWPGIHSSVSWQLGPRRSGRADAARDLLVIQQVTNLTDETLNLDVALRAPGVPHMRRMIASLGPGMTASRAFQIPGGKQRLSNRRVWVTLSDRYGPNQITEVLRIPPLIRTDDGGPREDAEDAQPLVQEPTGR